MRSFAEARLTRGTIEGYAVMNRYVLAIAPMTLALGASPARATDWWLVSGIPNDRVALFADVDTLARQDGGVALRVLRIDRSGRSAESVQHVACGDGAGSGGDDVLRRFACSSDSERESLGMILAGMTPEQAARMMFDLNPSDRPHPQG